MIKDFDSFEAAIDVFQIEEARRIIRVTHKGKRIRRIKCRPGYKRVGNRCVIMTGTEKITKRKAIRKSLRTKRSRPAVMRLAKRKRVRAMRKRKAFGLK